MPRPQRISRHEEQSAQDAVVRVHRAPRGKKLTATPAPAALAPAPVLPSLTTPTRGFALHAVAALTAIVAVVAVSQGALRGDAPTLTAQVTTGERSEIGLEHQKPVSLALSLTTNGAKGVADMRHDALETIAVSVPSSWSKREVGGVPFAAVTMDPPTFGFTRYHLPPGAIVSFDLTPPATILLHNPSGVSAEVRLTRVDLEKDTVERDIILVQEGSTLLW
ncbi:MAG TPA: hypothetical protein DEB30_05100 [Candidatus Peribacter riflensis]|nr:MAG: hypothetical protein A2398_05010 [Candidatus Peribacteria bacterium RIFOXYB1_FULL_57_12]HBH20218.1 hypothetical protein [Candidatus Peribacter riflensis]HBU10139.1 hypothetical protein [Candidatus Peribacter riflensis]